MMRVFTRAVLCLVLMAAATGASDAYIAAAGLPVGVPEAAAAPESPHEPPKSGLVRDTDVIASVGPWTITARDLLDSYEFGPSFVKRERAPLERHLEFMIYERLLAADARAKQTDTTAFVRERVSALEEDGAVDQLYIDDVLSRVRLTNAEIEDGIRKAGITVRLRWIVTVTQARADSIYAAFRAGRRIDDRLFARTDSGAAAVNETTLLKLSRDNPDVARAIAPLRPFELSAPVKGTSGYYLFRVEDVIRQPVVTENDREAARDQAITMLRTMKADSIAGQYVQRLMRQNAPVIKAEGYNIVRAFLGDKGLSHDKRIEWKIPSTFMTEAGALPITEAGRFLQKPLVTIGNRQLTVGEYLRWFDIRQFQLKTSSLEAFNHSVRQTIWKMTQDKLLSGIAYARGLNARDTVRRETEKWRAKLLYLSARSSLLRTVKVSDADVRSAYEKNKRSYAHSQGTPLPFEEVKQYVRSDLQQRAATALLYRKLEQLKHEITVSVDRDRVRSLEASIASERQPVEILYYKPGGTFPRVAFPTIDPAWQDF